MANSEFVDIIIEGFQRLKDFKIYNLENFKELKEKIQLCDDLGRRTLIYT